MNMPANSRYDLSLLRSRRRVVFVVGSLLFGLSGAQTQAQQKADAVAQPSPRVSVPVPIRVEVDESGKAELVVVKSHRVDLGEDFGIGATWPDQIPVYTRRRDGRLEVGLSFRNLSGRAANSLVIEQPLRIVRDEMGRPVLETAILRALPQGAVSFPDGFIAPAPAPAVIAVTPSLIGEKQPAETIVRLSASNHLRPKPAAIREIPAWIAIDSSAQARLVMARVVGDRIASELRPFGARVPVITSVTESERYLGEKIYNSFDTPRLSVMQKHPASVDLDADGKWTIRYKYTLIIGEASASPAGGEAVDPREKSGFPPGFSTSLPSGRPYGWTPVSAWEEKGANDKKPGVCAHKDTIAPSSCLKLYGRRGAVFAITTTSASCRS